MEISGYIVLLQLSYCPGERDWVNVLMVSDNEQEAHREMLRYAQQIAVQECQKVDYRNLPYEISIIDDDGIPQTRLELHWVRKSGAN